MVAITLLPQSMRIWGTFIAVIIGLTITGYTAARLGQSDTKKGVFRNIVAGILTMIVTFYIGHLLGQ